jgi:hypothetical protein
MCRQHSERLNTGNGEQPDGDMCRSLVERFEREKAWCSPACLLSRFVRDAQSGVICVATAHPISRATDKLLAYVVLKKFSELPSIFGQAQLSMDCAFVSELNF